MTMTPCSNESRCEESLADDRLLQRLCAGEPITPEITESLESAIFSLTTGVCYHCKRPLWLPL